MGDYTVGIDVGGTKIAYGLFDKNRNLIERREHPTNTSINAAMFLDGIVNEIGNFTTQHNIQPEDLLGVGVAVPSFLLYNDGIILKTANIPNLKNFPARSYLESALGTRVLLDNDSNVAALAEHRHGAGDNARHMIYCAISTGLGAGIIIDKKVFRGSYGFAGEGGHMIIDMDGSELKCQCGNSGCFECHIAGSKIVQLVAQRIREGQQSEISNLCGKNLENITARHIQDACDYGDELAIWALEHMAKYLAVWLYNLYLMLGINCYVFGGGLVKFGEMLFDRVKQQFQQLNQSDLPVYFRTAKLYGDVGIIGASELLYE